MTTPLADGAPPTERVELPLVLSDRRRRRRPRRSVVVALVVVLLAAGAGVGTWLGTRSAPTPGLVPVVTTTVVDVTTGTMRQTVTSSGTVEPAHEADLDFTVSGVVTAVDVAVGQSVAAGQPLAAVAPTALEATASQLQSDQAAVTSAQAQLASAQADVTAATLTSPISGTVASVALAVGQQVGGTGAAGDSGGAGSGSSTSSGGSPDGGSSSAQVVVVGTDAFLVDTSVDATEVGQLAVGQAATVTPAGSSQALAATVASVGLIASGGSGSGVASFPVVLDVTGSPGGLYAGTSASDTVVVKEVQGAVEVPSAAIDYRGAEPEVDLVESGRHVPTPVTTGLTTGGATQVTTGLHAGEKIAVQEVTFQAQGGTGGNDLRRGGPGGGPVGKPVPAGGGPLRQFNGGPGATGTPGG